MAETAESWLEKISNKLRLGHNVGGFTKKVQTSFIRPSDTDIYAALDVVGNTGDTDVVITFADAAAKPGGTGYITGVRIATNQAANVSEYELHFFKSEPAVVIADNAAWNELEADITLKLGTVNIPVIAKVGASGDIAVGEVVDLKIPYEAAASSRDIVAQLETVTGFTPASAQVFYIEITLEQNL